MKSVNRKPAGRQAGLGIFYLIVRIFPDLLTVNDGSGDEAGPFRTLPDVENIDPWQGHGKLLSARL